MIEPKRQGLRIAGVDSLRAWKLTTVLAVVALLCISTVAAIFHLETTSRVWDAHAETAVIERIDLLGGTYYTTGVDQKGPLFLATYSLAATVSDGLGIWFGVAGVIVLIALITGAATAVVGCLTSSTWPGAVASGACVAVYLMLGPEEYSRWLNSRSITSMLTLLAFTLLTLQLLRPERWLHRWWVTALSGGFMGLAVQTMPTTAIVALSLLVWMAVQERVLSTNRAKANWLTNRTLIWAASALVVAATAPLYYWIRGAFEEFWRYWFTFNRLYASAAGWSGWELITIGAKTFLDYYHDHPLLLVVAVLFLSSGFAFWSRLSARERVVWTGLTTWYLAEVSATVISQRFFGHHFVLVFVPVGVMASVLVSDLSRYMTKPVQYALAPLLVAALLVAPGTRLDDGLAKLGQFEGVEKLEEAHVRSATDQVQVVRAVTAMTVQPDETIYIWHRLPHFYTYFERVAASRYIENRWLTGEVYGPFVFSPDYVLAGTAERFAQDLSTTTPVAVFDFVDQVLPEAIEETIETATETSYPLAFDSGDIHMRLSERRLRDLQSAFVMRAGSPSSFLELPSDGGWKWMGSDLIWEPGTTTRPAIIDPEASCYAIKGRLMSSSSKGVTMVLGPPGTRLDGSGIAIANGAVEVFQPPEPGREHRLIFEDVWSTGSSFTAIVRGRLLMLIIDDRIVGAVEAGPGQTQLFLSPESDDGFRLAGVSVGKPNPNGWNLCW